MRVRLVAALCLSCLLSAMSAYSTERGIMVKWYGQSCFLITTTSGTRILTDPVVFKGYRLPEGIAPDIVTVSHEHPDHNSVSAVSGTPELLRGCTEGNRHVIEIDRKLEDVRIFSAKRSEQSRGGLWQGRNIRLAEQLGEVAGGQCDAFGEFLPEHSRSTVPFVGGLSATVAAE